MINFRYGSLQPAGFTTKSLLHCIFTACCTTLATGGMLNHISQCKAADVQEIAASYRKQEAALHSLYVSWHSQSVAVGRPADINKYLYTTCYVNETRTFAFKGKMRYATAERSATFEHIVEKMPDGSPKIIKTNPAGEWAFNGQAAYLLDGKKNWRRHPVGLIDAPGRLTVSDTSYFNQDYLRRIFRAVPDVFEVDSGRCKLNLACLIESGDCKLLPTTQKVDGTECVVIEWGESVAWTELDQSIRKEFMEHSLWCDPQRNFAVIQHELYSIKDNKRVLRERVRASDFVELLDDLWLPKRCTWERCAPAHLAPPELLGKPLIKYTYDVQELHANDVPDEIFTPEINVGTYIVDSRYLKDGEPITYTIPASEAELNAVIQTALKGESALPPANSFGGRFGLGLFVLVNTIFIVALIAWALRRRFKT